MIDFKKTIEFKIYADVWNLHKKYYVPEASDMWWDKLVEEASNLPKRYEGDARELANRLVLAVLKDIELKAEKL